MKNRPGTEEQQFFRRDGVGPAPAPCARIEPLI